MKKTTYITICIITIFSCSLDSSKKKISNVGTSGIVESKSGDDINKLLTYVLLDLTTSIDTNNIEKIIEHTNDIIDKAAPNSKIYFSEIHENFLPFLGEFTKLDLTKSKRSEKMQDKISTDDFTKKLEAKIKNRYTEMSINKNHPNSCIINGLVAAHKFHNTSANKDSKLEIIIVSDMVEECESTPLGRLFFTASGEKSAIKKLNNPNLNQKIDLTAYDITIILTPLSQNNSAYLPSYKLEKLWSKLFEVYGFDAKKAPVFSRKLP